MERWPDVALRPRLGQYVKSVRQLEKLARERYGRPALALAVRWILDFGDPIALWDARRPDQLTPVADVMGWSLDSDAMQEIDRILEPVEDPVGPEFMAPPTRTPELTAAESGSYTMK